MIGHGSHLGRSAELSALAHDSIPAQLAPALGRSRVEGVFRGHLVTARAMRIARIQSRPDAPRRVDDGDLIAAQSSPSATFSLSVGQVLGLGSEKQVIWSHARADVATMKDAESLRYVSDGQQPTTAVSQARWYRTRGVECAVAVSESGSSPDPAVATLINVSPEQSRRVGNRAWHSINNFTANRMRRDAEAFIA